MASSAEAGPLLRRLRAKPPPIDLNVIPPGAGSTPNRIQFWPAAQQRVAPELGLSGPGSPTPFQEGGLSPGVALSPLLGEGPVEGGWAGLPAHILELIFAALRDSQGRWPSRKVLFSICGVCKLWRRVGHTLFFSNVWHHHSDVIVHPSQLFTLSPQPLRLHTSDHLLRCFVHRMPIVSPGLSPRFGRLWHFALYLGSDHRSLRNGSVAGQSTGGGVNSGPSGLSGGGVPSASPQLLLLAEQTGRRSYHLLLSPATGPGPGHGERGMAQALIGWRSPQTNSNSAGGGLGRDDGQSGWRSPQSHVGNDGNGDGHATGGGGGVRSSRDSGVVAVLRSNIRCSHYELIPKSSCPWARRLIAVAGYMPPQGSPPQPLIQLEYRLRVRGIMLPRRMKVQVPVPHSLQRVVHNPLYDLHEPVADGPGLAAQAWPPVFGVNGGGGGAAGAVAAVMAPPAQGAARAAPHPGFLFGGGGLLEEGQEGLMDNLEDILEAAMRTEPLLFANMVDAAVVRPADDDEAAAGRGGAGGGGDRVRTVPGPAIGSRALRRFGSTGGGLGSALLRGFLLNRLHSGGGAGGGGGGGEVQPTGGMVQWWGPGSPGSRRSCGIGAEGGPADAAGGGSNDGMGGWAPASPMPAPVVQLQNKAPHWNDGLMCWCLNFRGRVKMASVKNFQLMCSVDKAERCVMQFGKVEEGIYILDFNPCVLTAAQAFAAALSTFETKYLL